MIEQRRDDEVKPAFLSERSGGAKRTIQRVKRSVCVTSGLEAGLEVVDGDESALAAGADGKPVVAAEANR